MHREVNFCEISPVFISGFTSGTSCFHFVRPRSDKLGHSSQLTVPSRWEHLRLAGISRCKPLRLWGDVGHESYLNQKSSFHFFRYGLQSTLRTQTMATSIAPIAPVDPP